MAPDTQAPVAPTPVAPTQPVAAAAPSVPAVAVPSAADAVRAKLDQPEPSGRSLMLPVSVVGPVDLGRVIREVDALDAWIQQATVRNPGGEVKMPKTSKLLDDTILLNKLDLVQSPDRVWLVKELKTVKLHAPLLHISFSADPSASFIQKLMIWLRKEIDPRVLLTVGMQPNIGAGCLIRTTNKYFDFSLRANFMKKRELLMSKLQEGVR